MNCLTTENWQACKVGLLDKMQYEIYPLYKVKIYSETEGAVIHKFQTFFLDLFTAQFCKDYYSSEYI